MDDMPHYQRPAEDRLYRSGYEHKIKIIPTSSEYIYAITSSICTCHYFIFQHLVAKAPAPPDYFPKYPTVAVTPAHPIPSALNLIVLEGGPLLA